MVKVKSALAIGAVSALVLAGCTNPDGTTNNTATGTAVGAGMGAALGAAVSDDKGRGAVIGGILGGIAGNLIGQDLDRQEAALRQGLGGSGAYIVNTGDQLIVTLPESITFPVDSAQLKSSIVDDLRVLARNLNDYPNTTVDVVGHTDNTGSSAYNQSLSERRASSVRSVLVNSGVSSGRVRAYGVGETQPIATNATYEGRQKNRRVEIYITPIRR